MADVGPVLAALAEPTRRAILERLRNAPRSVSEIAEEFDISRPAVSQHLRVLEDAGLLRSQRSGRQNFYGVDMTGIGILRQYIDSFWDDMLGAFHAAALDASARRRRGQR
jgi:DNA-binding transcriptional ArsR family regulator